MVVVIYWLQWLLTLAYLVRNYHYRRDLVVVELSWGYGCLDLSVCLLNILVRLMTILSLDIVWHRSRKSNSQHDREDITIMSYSLSGFDNIFDNSFQNEIQDNMVEWLDWGLLNKGNYFNVTLEIISR